MSVTRGEGRFSPFVERRKIVPKGRRVREVEEKISRFSKWRDGRRVAKETKGKVGKRKEGRKEGRKDGYISRKEDAKFVKK